MTELQEPATERPVPIEGEVVEQSRGMILNSDRNVLVGSVPLPGFEAVLTRAADIATKLSRIIDDRKLFKDIKGKKFVYCEGWTTLGAMLGVSPRVVETVESPTTKGEFISVVEAVRTSDGMVIGQANASCGPDETDWAKRTRQARRSMSETRATGKVMRLMFSWIMQLAGYEVLPAEEADEVIPHDNPRQRNGAPQVVPRDERITTAQLRAFFDSWKQWRIAEGAPADSDDLLAWMSVFIIPPSPVTNTAAWDRFTLNMCIDELAKEKNSALDEVQP